MDKHLLAVKWLQDNRFGSHWTLSGDTYDGFIWLDDPETKPTAQDLGLN